MNPNKLVTIPGCAERILTVGALEQDGKIAEYSCEASKAEKPNLYAPGDIAFCYPNRPNVGIAVSGTSIAAPLALAVAAAALGDGLITRPFTHQAVLKCISQNDKGVQKLKSPSIPATEK